MTGFRKKARQRLASLTDCQELQRRPAFFVFVFPSAPAIARVIEILWRQMNDPERIRTFVKLSIASARSLT
jgi:hypothetical protein